MEIDVTDLVQSQSAGNGLLSVRVYSDTAGSERHIVFGARENTIVANRPSLETPVFRFLGAEGGQLTSPMVAASDQAASGGQFVWVPQGTGKNLTSPGGPGAVTLSYNAPAGTYALWARTIAPDGDSDSFFVLSDTVMVMNPWHVSQSTNWRWSKVTNLELNGGAHTLQFNHREDGTKLDSVILTTDLDWIP